MPDRFEVDAEAPMFRAVCERLDLKRWQVDKIVQAVYLHARSGVPPPNPVAVVVPGMPSRSVSVSRLWVQFEIRGGRIILLNLSEQPSD